MAFCWASMTRTPNSVASAAVLVQCTVAKYGPSGAAVRFVGGIGGDRPGVCPQTQSCPCDGGKGSLDHPAIDDRATTAYDAIGVGASSQYSDVRIVQLRDSGEPEVAVFAVTRFRTSQPAGLGPA